MRKTGILLILLLLTAMAALLLVSCSSGEDSTSSEILYVRFEGQTTTYEQGDAFSAEGARLVVTYANGKTESLPLTEEMVAEKPDLTLPGRQKVTITYQGQHFEYEIYVYAAEAAEYAFSDIAPTYAGAPFSCEKGELILRYADGESRVIPLSDEMLMETPDTSAPGESEARFLYNGKIYRYVFVVQEDPVTVMDAALQEYLLSEAMEGEHEARFSLQISAAGRSYGKKIDVKRTLSRDFSPEESFEEISQSFLRAIIQNCMELPEGKQRNGKVTYLSDYSTFFSNLYEVISHKTGEDFPLYDAAEDDSVNMAMLLDEDAESAYKQGFLPVLQSIFSTLPQETAEPLLQCFARSETVFRSAKADMPALITSLCEEIGRDPAYYVAQLQGGSFRLLQDIFDEGEPPSAKRAALRTFCADWDALILTGYEEKAFLRAFDKLLDECYREIGMTLSQKDALLLTFLFRGGIREGILADALSLCKEEVASKVAIFSAKEELDPEGMHEYVSLLTRIITIFSEEVGTPEEAAEDLFRFADSYLSDEGGYAASAIGLAAALYLDKVKGRHIDYNEIMKDAPLPKAIESVDYNKVIANLFQKESVKDLLDISSITVSYECDEEGCPTKLIMRGALHMKYDVQLTALDFLAEMRLEITL